MFRQRPSVFCQMEVLDKFIYHFIRSLLCLFSLFIFGIGSQGCEELEVLHYR